MNKKLILADLNLYAVLPRLEELVRLDEEAKNIAKDMNVVIQFTVYAGPTVQLAFSGGRVKAHRGKTMKANVALFFVSCEQLNRMFNNEKVIPIPYKGIHRIGDLKKFTKLTEILPRYLQPSDADMADPDFRKKHVEMSLMVGLSGSRSIAEYDIKMKKVVDKLLDGSILFRVLPDGPELHVVIENKRIYAVNAPIDDPSATLEINGVDLAVELLAGKLDSFAALGAGDLRASGLLPLADEFNALLDRVGYYLA